MGFTVVDETWLLGGIVPEQARVVAPANPRSGRASDEHHIWYGWTAVLAAVDAQTAFKSYVAQGQRAGFSVSADGECEHVWGGTRCTATGDDSSPVGRFSQSDDAEPTYMRITALLSDGNDTGWPSSFVEINVGGPGHTSPPDVPTRSPASNNPPASSVGELSGPGEDAIVTPDRRARNGPPPLAIAIEPGSRLIAPPVLGIGVTDLGDEFTLLVEVSSRDALDAYDAQLAGLFDVSTSDESWPLGEATVVERVRRCDSCGIIVTRAILEADGSGIMMIRGSTRT